MNVEAMNVYIDINRTKSIILIYFSMNYDT